MTFREKKVRHSIVSTLIISFIIPVNYENLILMIYDIYQILDSVPSKPHSLFLLMRDWAKAHIAEKKFTSLNKILGINFHAVSSSISLSFF